MSAPFSGLAFMPPPRGGGGICKANDGRGDKSAAETAEVPPSVCLRQPAPPNGEPLHGRPRRAAPSGHLPLKGKALGRRGRRPLQKHPIKWQQKTGRKISVLFFLMNISACPCRPRRSAVPSCPPPRRRYPSVRTRSSPWAGPPEYGSGCRSRRLPSWPASSWRRSHSPGR